jgi:hypothetical protein
MWDAFEVIGAFWAAMLITYAAIVAVSAVSDGILGAAKRSNRWIRAYYPSRR